MGKFVQEQQQGIKALDPGTQVEIQKRLLHCKEYFNIDKGKFAEALGSAPKSSSNWFGEKTKTPQLRTLIALADEFGISLNWLLLGEGRRIRGTKKAIEAARRQRKAGRLRAAKSRAPAQLPRTKRIP